MSSSSSFSIDGVFTMKFMKIMEGFNQTAILSLSVLHGSSCAPW